MKQDAASSVTHVGKLSSGLIDQGLYSINTIAVVALTTRQLSDDDAGRFATAFIAQLIMIVLLRSLVGTVHLIGSSGASPHDRSTRERLAVSASLWLGAAIAVSSCALLFATDLLDRTSLVWFAIGMTFAASQDVLRHIAMARQRFDLSMFADLAWLTITLTTPLLIPESAAERFPPLMGWAVGGLASAAMLLRLLGVRPSLSLARAGEHFHSTLAQSKEILLEQTLGAIAGFAVIIVVALWTSAEDVGFVRVAQTAVGPIGVVSQGLIPLFTTRFAASRERFDGNLRTAVRVGLVTAGLGLLGAIPYVLVGRSVGTRLFGDVWEQSHDFGLLLWIWASVMAGRAGLVAYARATNQLQSLRRIRVTETALVASLAIGLSLIIGISGYVYGILAGAVLSSLLWVRFVKANRRGFTYST